MATLKRQIVELEAKVSRERDRSKTPSLGAGSPRSADRHYPLEEADDDTLLASHDVRDPLPPSRPASLGAGMPPPTADAPATPGAGSAPLRSDISRSDTAPESTHPRRSARCDTDSAPPRSGTLHSEAALDSAPSGHPDDTSGGQQRCGKAPPIEFFSGEDPAILLDDWLPSLERASLQNGWSTADKLMQLSGHLRGRALQEWRLLHRSEQQTYSTAIEGLRTRFNPGSKTMAAQDFCHSLQRDGEVISDFIRRLEKTYQIAYGKDDLNAATWDALLYGQLYEGLCYDVMLSPAVSGAQGYRELCTAAKGEKR